MKPMHRVTRYPILFKRLLSVVQDNHPLYNKLDFLINRFEELVKEVNENVRIKDSLCRIYTIEGSLDFGHLYQVKQMKC